MEPLYTVSETAEYLRTSRAQVYNFMNDGSLPYILIGRHRRIKESDLKTFVETAKRGSPKEAGHDTIDEAQMSQQVAA